MQSNPKTVLELFVVLLLTNSTFGQVIITEVNSVNALAYGNSRKLAVNHTGIVSLVFHDSGEIFYTESNDRGLTWFSPINVSLNSGVSEFPSIAIDSTGAKHIVWQDNTLPDNPDQFDEKIRIYHKNFMALSEIPERHAIPIGESVGNSTNPSITVGEDGKLYAAWAAFMGLTVGWEINYSEGTLIGSGLSGSYDWTLPEIPGEPLGIGSSFFPTIDISGEIIFITWLEEDPFFQLVNLIKFRKGDIWSDPFSLSDQAIGPFPSSVAGVPSMVVDGDTTAHIIFQEKLEVQDNTFDDIFYLEYHPEDTLNFESGENVSQIEETSSNTVIILDADKNLYVVWEQRSANTRDIFISSRDSQGWSIPENISFTQKNSFTPHIALTENDSLLVIWLEGDSPPYQLRAKKIKALITSIKNLQDDSNLREFQLFKNYPNPFNANTSVSFYVPRPSPVELSVWNIRGQLVKTLFRGGDTNGYHTISWDGTDDKGASVSSGIYLITLESRTVLKTIQAVLIK